MEYISSLNIEQISFLNIDNNGHRFVSLDIDNYVDTRNIFKKMEIDFGSPIIYWMTRHKKPLNLKLIEESCKAGTVENTENLEAVKSEMKRAGINLLIPVVLNNEVKSILAVLGKSAMRHDIRLFQMLASILELSFENSQAHEELIDVADHNDEILQSMTDGVFTTDMKGKIIAFNKRASQLTDSGGTFAAGRICSDVWGENSVLYNLLKNTFDGNIYRNYETNLATKERGLIPVSVNTTLLKDRIGRSNGVLVVISDLSDVKQLEHRVRQSDKLAALGTMAAGMAHEIKNPLSSMKVLSQLMAKKFGEDDFRKKFIEIMPREIGRIDRIVESLLGFARASSPRLEEVKIDEVIGEALRFLEEQIKSANVVIKNEIKDVPVIVGDVQQLIQVFVNLFINAIQAMPDGGTLKIAADGSIKNIRIEVSDTGHGVPKEYLSKLFDPFFTTKYGGTGLGLTIVHSIIEGHGGEIRAESDFGKGTKFAIILPLVRKK